MKINRDALKAAFLCEGDEVSTEKFISVYGVYPYVIIDNAAALLLEITGENWEVPEEMFSAAMGPRLTNVSITQIEEIIEKAIRELVE